MEKIWRMKFLFIENIPLFESFSFFFSSLLYYIVDVYRESNMEFQAVVFSYRLQVYALYVDLTWSFAVTKRQNTQRFCMFLWRLSSRQPRKFRPNVHGIGSLAASIFDSNEFVQYDFFSICLNSV